MLTREVFILTLLQIESLGRRAAKRIASQAQAPESVHDIVDLVHDSYRIEPTLFPPAIEEIHAAFYKASRICDAAILTGTSILTAGSTNFPQRLCTIKSPPLLLFAKGNIACLTEPHNVAVIGTREPTETGYRTSEALGSAFAGRGCVVISGLARGCDTGAHTGCVLSRGKTVAILAHGLNTIYPPENRRLAYEIVEESGCLLSEYPPDERPKSKYFVERDRLQSGISSSVIIVETDLTGGAMHTARFCLEEKKPLGCMTYQNMHHNPMTEGNRHLIERGNAVKLSSVEDALTFAELALTR